MRFGGFGSGAGMPGQGAGPVRWLRAWRARPHLFLAALFVVFGGAALWDGAGLGAEDDDPDYPHGSFEAECSLCHSSEGWSPAVISDRFDHGQYGFPLEGAHAEAQCLSCHRTLEFGRSETLCAQCHQDVHEGEMGTDCADCHSTRSFGDLARMREHHQLTRFPLTGAHTEVDCQDCHAPAEQGRMTYVNTATECASCHLGRYQAVVDPPHEAANFSRECQACHGTATWTGARFAPAGLREFDHAATGFPLDGAHAAQECQACHGDGVYAGKDPECVSCHRAEYQATTTPPHEPSGFPTDCASCHGTASWAGAGFDHTARTQFPLTGAHVEVACMTCHGDGTFAGRSTECRSCHQGDYDATRDPPHVEAGFPLDCQTCHSTTAWAGAEFDHDTQTTFPLTGAHVEQACRSCHGGGVYQGLDTQCQACHLADYNGTTDPPHAVSGFPTDCETCHNTTSWDGAEFDHTTQTTFPLTGAHIAQGCMSCHGGGVYQGLATECASCHQSDYDATTDPVHSAAGFPTDCQTCHNTTQWLGAAFDHDTQTTFPLTGAHIAQECMSCHGGGVYQGLATECASCHLTDYNATTDPVHSAAGFPTDCQTCHNTTQWLGAAFDHDTQTSFPLTGAHVEQQCRSCHGGGVYQGLDTQCQACHQTDYDATTDPVHSEAGFPTECETCHNTTQWLGAAFDHDTQTSFPLTGAHVEQQCRSCHGGGVYQGLATECASCHQGDYDATTDPVHSAAGFPTECETCHNTTSWDGAAFDHDTQTTFPLTGAHVEQACRSCHGGGVYQGLATECASCHQSDFDATTDPVHSAAGFPTECETCHNTTSWDGAEFDHDTQTSFPLTGAHVEQQCRSCHGGGVYQGLDTQCQACHQTDYDATTDPVHSEAGFPTECETCHNTTAWDGAEFDHNTQTTFPLTGAHIAQECMSCHGGGVYQGLDTQCQACHLADYNGTTDPPHAASGFPTDCETCHNTTSWDGAEFDHNTQTTFPLTGAHIAQACASCHGGGVYRGLATECQACHLTDYNGTTDPPHAASGFPTDCETCHNTTAWDGAEFDHDTQTTFPLTGAHVEQQCRSCHGGGVYQGLATECASCHLTDYNGTTDPAHAVARFPTECETCHNTTSWDGAEFDHDTQTSFPLTGAHIAQECMSCHGGGVYQGLDTQCQACHLADYNGTTDPPHAASGFPTDCETCHNTTQWLGAAFDHNTQTSFPLTGAHIAQECMSCHGGGVYQGLETQCRACHLADYNGTTDPPHAASGFPTDCETCHNTTSWDGAEFDHNTQTTFPLTGAHIAQECMSCHGGGVYQGLETQCRACHLADYNGTTDPPHAASGFPTDCETCHNTTQWLGAAFDHNTQTSFPLTGSHLAVECLSCHGGGVYQGLATECQACHLTDYNATTDPPHAAAGFDTQCRTCHTPTTWMDAVFDHDTQTTFPLTGAHIVQDCMSCHGGGVYQGLDTQCQACHLADYNGTTDPAHAAAGFPLDCQSCHNTTAWDGASFDHDSRWFPIYSGEHRGRWDQCADCHTNPANFAEFSCLGCHPHSDKSKTDGDHHDVGGYQYNSLACYSCHPRGRH